MPDCGDPCSSSTTWQYCACADAMIAVYPVVTMKMDFSTTTIRDYGSLAATNCMHFFATTNSFVFHCCCCCCCSCSGVTARGMVQRVRGFCARMVIDEMYGNFVIWLCVFWPDDGVWSVDWKRRGRLADVSCCDAAHWPDRCCRLSSTLYWSRTDPTNFALTLIDRAIVGPALLD